MNNTVALENENETRPDDSAPFGRKTLETPEDHQTLDRTLTEIRSGRSLEKIVSSIENFLYSQITRLEKSLEECECAADNDRIVQTILSEFESEKQAWEEKRKAEILRLSDASEKLAQAWKQLEDERRNWLDVRDHDTIRKSR